LLSIKLSTESGEPPRASLFFLLGGLYERAKDIKKAILNYKKCLTLETGHFGACLHLANLLANVGEGQRAAKYFKHAIKVANGGDVGKESLVNAYFGLGKTLQQYSDNKDAPL
jgi:tetratricopeptide (TPR) repeat protein